jgi:hypothetical protein
VVDTAVTTLDAATPDDHTPLSGAGQENLSAAASALDVSIADADSRSDFEGIV